jgi:hypothetical protein
VPTEYLLPCTCGRAVVVQARQAGQTVRCECGQELPVPTMRELGSLEQRQSQQAPVAVAWTTRQALVSLGLLILLIGIGLTGFVYWKMPRFDPVATGHELDNLHPHYLFQWWRYYERGMPREPSEEFLAAKQRETMLRRWSYATIGISLVGILIIGIGLVAPALAPRRARR